jgi:hypothetical protein
MAEVININVFEFAKELILSAEEAATSGNLIATLQALRNLLWRTLAR